MSPECVVRTERGVFTVELTPVVWPGGLETTLFVICDEDGNEVDDLAIDRLVLESIFN